MTPSLETKVAVLETQVNSHQLMIGNNQELTARLVDRLDVHIQAATQRDAQLQEHLAEVTTAVTVLSTNVAETNSTLKAIAGLAESNNIKWVRLDAIAMTITKVATVVVLLVGAAWSVYTYVSTPAAVTVSVETKGK